MAYAIMRCKKLSSFGSVAAALKHCYRERETPNADTSKTPENEHYAARTTTEAMGRLRALLPTKRRKDAVLAIEYVMTASPEWWKSASQEQQQAFFQRSLKWLADKYGEQNIITATVHRDEITPHLSAFVVPLTQDGRLSAKQFIGNKSQMSRDQTTFAAAVADLGLQRGVERSKAKHVDIKQYYARASKPTPPMPQIDVPEPGFRDRLNPGEYGRKVAEAVVEQIKPTWSALQAKVREKEAAEQRAREAAATAMQALAEAKRERERAEKLEEITRLFTPDEIAKTARKAEIDRERQRRIDDLARVERETAGASCTFAQHALEAIKKAGDPSKVDWRMVEAQTIREAIAEHGQDVESVISAINRYSPERADPASHQEIREAVMRHAPRLQAEYQQQAQRNNDRSFER